jgi:hypothetical protein
MFTSSQFCHPDRSRSRKAMTCGVESLPGFAEAPSEVEEEVEGDLLL